MGRFSCLVVVLAACAENPVGVPDEGTDGITIPDDVTSVSITRMAPSVCGVATWPEKVADTNVDLSVAGRDSGAALLTTAGGVARGMTVDKRMSLVSDQSIPGSFDRAGISYAANRYTATTMQNGSVDVWMMTDDLTSSDLLFTVDGTALAKQTFLPIQGGLVMPVGDQNGITLHRLADSYEPIASARFATTDPVEGMTAASTGTTALFAWTTSKNCFLGSTDGVNAKVTDPKFDACQNPHLAVDTGSLRGVLMYDSPEGVRLSITKNIYLTTSDVLYSRGTSPRALFDGKNFWVSWINDRGIVVVGIVDMTTHEVMTTAVVDPRPSANSYELAMVNGSPWVFAVDADGYSGHRLCATPVPY
jgi:hypothetical protein